AADGALTPWILCTDAPDGVVGPDSLDRRREARLIDHAHRYGIPAPGIFASGSLADRPHFGGDWFVMQRLAGTASVGPLVRDPQLIANRGRLGQQKAEILASIHALPIPDGVFEDIAPPAEVARVETQRWSKALAATPTAKTPVMTEALERLAGWNVPAPERVVVVHGDYRTGNLLYDPSGVAGITGVLDWEMAHPGDPLEDVAWAGLAAWRVGTGLVGALLPEQDWIAAYETAAERTVDPGALRFWQVLTGVKMSLLAWRAVERTPPGREQDLLQTLFDQLQAELLERLG
ncbi:MAG: phosphotransferase family protein, partial [Acidimicrobiales bacterium]